MNPSNPPQLCESDFWVGRRGSLKRSLVCALQGYIPVLVHLGGEQLAAVYRTGGSHLSIHGTLAISESEDGGISWTTPMELFPRGMDYRNPAIGLDQTGQLLVCAWAAGKHAYQLSEDGLKWSLENRALWKEPALALIRRDASGTWSDPIFHTSPLLDLCSPYGRIVNGPAGTLLMNLYGNPIENPQGARNASVLALSRDNGASWDTQRRIGYGYSETALLWLAENETLYAAARCDDGSVHLLSSQDLGESWSEPLFQTRVGEHPADLTALPNGRVLLTYGRRIRPMGCAARLFDPQTGFLDTAEILLAGDGVEDADLGYPSTVRLASGGLVTVLYYASGSQMSRAWAGWGSVSCQALHWSSQFFEL
ncbi:MAG: exo-alpha-sialidase [Acidobacteria bacterium]|nr:exo-alpha-sialidase [Acidobacteriota bacterium]